MNKKSLFYMYKLDDIPDHVRHEFEDVVKQITEAIQPFISEENCNYVLSAMNHVMAMLIKIYVVERPDAIKHASLKCAEMFLKNVEFYTGVDILNKGNE